MNAQKIIDDVSLILGEVDGESGTAVSVNLRNRIRMEIERCAARAVGATPRPELTGWQPFTETQLKPTGNGGASMALPPDFLLLSSVRLKSWDRPALYALPEGSWLEEVESTDIPGIKASPARPLCFMSHSGDKAFLNLYPATTGDCVEKGWYLPVPAIGPDGEIMIPPAAYRRTLDYIVETLRI